MSSRAPAGWLGEAARLAFEVMRAHKMRSGLLVLGVAIGVSVLMTMVSILLGLSRRIEAEITQDDNAIVTLSKFDPFLQGNAEDDAVRARPDVEPEDARALQELCPSVALAEFFIDANRGTIITRGDRRTRPVAVNGAGVQALYVYNLPIELGRSFTQGEVLARRDVVFLGAGPAQDLFPDEESPLGKRVRLGGKYYTVVGIGAERNSVFGGMGDNYVFIPWTTFRKNQGSRDDPYYVYMTVAPGRDADDVMEEARAVMRARHGLRPADPDDFVLMPNDRVVEFVKQFTGPIGLVLLALSSIGLSVGGIGVMNIMLVSVTERTREIGIRMAVGARRKMILMQFLLEAATLTGIGGAVGVLAGALFAYLISWGTGMPAVVHPLAAVVGVVFSAGIGIFFGLFPAARAARLDPIAALGRE
ncbi:ABC transporter permease [bacterium]|nr:ABC transporter permease [bacterium]